MSKATVILADDHTIVLEGLKGLLQGEFEIVGIANDGRELLSQAERMHPDIIVVDIAMPLLNGMEAIRHLTKIGAKAKIIVLTMHRDAAYAKEAFDAGASGYVLKHSASSELITSMHETLQGNTFVSPVIASKLMRLYRKEPDPETNARSQVTARQQEVLRLLADCPQKKENEMRTRFTRLVPAILACQFIAGCGTIGSRTVSRDQFDYTAAISDSWKSQMLLNLVKLRYADPPTFLEVSSIITQYSVETTLSAGASWDAMLPGNSQSLGAAGRYTDRPTITYSPLRGEQFTRSLMTPIPPAALCSMVQAGWSVDRVFLTCVSSINGLDNGAATMALSRQGDPDFYRLIAALRRIQQAGGVSVRVEKKADRTATVMFFDSGADDSLKDDVHLARTLLGINPGVNEYELVYGRLAASPNELAILSRSMLEVLLEIATGVEVPQADLDEGRVMPVLVQTAAEQAGLVPNIHIHSGSRAPDDAFVSVAYRGNQFWIDDRDPRSKGILSFLMILFSLAETGGPSRAPLVTIPAG